MNVSRAVSIHALPLTVRARWLFLEEKAARLRSFSKEQNRKCYSHGAAHLRLSGAVLVFGVAALFSGCAISPLATRTASFATAANAAVTQTNNAYQLVNQTYIDAQTATMVANYDVTGFDASKIKPFFPAKDLQVRTQILSSLQQYATLLAVVAGNQPVTDLETQVSAAGTALQTLGKDDASFTGFKVTPTEQNVLQSAVVAFGGALIEHERAKALPGILDKMNPPIQQICTILESDIGTLSKPGLADQLHRSYDDQIAAEQKFILDNDKTLNAEEKRTEIETLPKLVQAQQQADQQLAATSNALAALAAAHAALTSTKTAKDSPAFKVELDVLVQNIQSVNGYYTSLKTTSK